MSTQGSWLEGALICAGLAALGWWWLRTHLLGKCLWCRGTGRNPLSTENRFGTCRHCGGTRQRTRRI